MKELNYSSSNSIIIYSIAIASLIKEQSKEIENNGIRESDL